MNKNPCILCEGDEQDIPLKKWGKSRCCEIGLVCPKCYPTYKKTQTLLIKSDLINETTNLKNRLEEAERLTGELNIKLRKFGLNEVEVRK